MAGAQHVHFSTDWDVYSDTRMVRLHSRAGVLAQELQQAQVAGVWASFALIFLTTYVLEA